MKLFHYTDAAALLSILETGQFWYSDIRHLNDTMEYRDGVSVLSRVFRACAGGAGTLPPFLPASILTHLLDKSAREFTFVGSYSRAQDQLGQWRGYCPKEGGYALEFEIKTENIKDFGANFHACIYEQEEKEKSAMTLYATLASMQDTKNKNNTLRHVGVAWAVVASCKHIGFKEETEVRDVIFDRKQAGPVKFRTRGARIIPYVAVPGPIRHLAAVWVGPCPNQHLLAESLQRTIDELWKDRAGGLFGLKPIVKKSEISYLG